MDIERHGKRRDRRKRIGGAALRALLLAALAAFSALTSLPAVAQRAVSYADLLRNLSELDRLTLPQTGVKSVLFSSWDRNGRNSWGANGDAGQYLREEPNGEAVMMEADGPGCIVRIWSANPMGKIRFYIDGDTKPTYEWSFPEIFTGKVHPFVRPLVYQRDGAQSASDSYVPIPFAKHIKVTADRKHGQYYHFNVLEYPAGTRVPSFRLPLAPDEERALSAAADAWSNLGRDPKPRLEGQQTVKRTLTLKPGQKAVVADLCGPGTIRAIRASVSSEQRYAWRKVVLRGAWDGADWPQLLTPLGPLFGFDWQAPEYASLIAGCRNGQGYFYYPMPFRQSAALSLTNYLEKPAKVSIEIDWAPAPNLPQDSLYFYARWRRDAGITGFEYPFLETAGSGHFVGVTMPIDHPLPGWWGEGDEKVWVDDDTFPLWIGTGSEDYFGDAWGIRYLSEPSFGCSADKDNRTCNYRWHFLDLIPFDERFRMTIENYGPNGAGPRGQYEYTSTAFWYQKEKTPPFDSLWLSAYVGGTKPDQKPEGYLYDQRIFHDLSREDLRTYGLALPFATEAEDLFADSLRAGRGRIVTDASRQYEFNHERAVDFGRVRAGRVLAEGTLKTQTGAAYFPKLHTAPESDAAPLTLEIDGRRLTVRPDTKAPSMALSGIALKPGDHKVRLIAAGEGRAIVDCLQLEPAPREGGVMEAEEMEVARSSGSAPAPGDVTTGVSGGRVLQWKPAAAGESVTIRLSPRPKNPYTLGVRAMRGPDSGIIQAFSDGKPAGPPLDLYAPEAGREPGILPLGPVSPESGEIEIRVIGKNPKSGGYAAGLDYFRFEPHVLGPATSEGVHARILGVRGGAYGTQDLGANYYQGHQLWVQPSSRNAVLEIALTVEREGDYDLATRYTSSWDYATVQASLDGKDLGPRVDCYSPEVRLMDETPLGRVHLTAGTHVLRFKAVDKNARSAGYLIGIETVTVKRVQ